MDRSRRALRRVEAVCRTRPSVLVQETFRSAAATRAGCAADRGGHRLAQPNRSLVPDRRSFVSNDNGEDRSKSAE